MRVLRCEHPLRETARLIHEEREACRGRSGVTMPRRYESDILVCLRRTIDDIVRQFAAGTAREQGVGWSAREFAGAAAFGRKGGNRHRC